MAKKETLVGAHTSIAKGVFNSLYQGEKLKANTIQFFTANQRQWKAKEISSIDAKKFIKAKKETGIKTTISHNNYLINLGSPKKNIQHISKIAFLEEIQRCHLLEVDYLVFHPGSAVGSLEKDCLDTIAQNLLSFKTEIKKGSTRLLLETTAGQGTNVGYKFEQLGYIIKKVKSSIPIGVCLDTCHIFAAGYDIRTKDGWKKTLLDFSKNIGLNNLLAFHVNDSKVDLGSKKDRHESIGKGKLGFECFKFLMKEEKFRDLPKILETPNVDLWKKEIELLKKYAG